jgi:hypothetical protein
VANTFHEALKKYSPFREYIKVLIEDFFYLVRNGEDAEENIYELTKGANIHLQIDRSSWENYTKWLRSLDEKQLEQVKEKMATYMLENPTALHHVLYRLYKLPET